MKRIHIMTLAAFAAMSFASIASASDTPGIDARQARQHQRIVQGERSGQLTRGEARRLRAGQRHIRHMKQRAKADGKVTRLERRRMHHALDRNSRRIYRLKHNRRHRKV